MESPPRPVTPRQEPPRRWLAAAFCAAALHAMLLAMIVVRSDNRDIAYTDQAPPVMVLLADPEAPAAAPSEMPLDKIQQDYAAPLPPVATEPVIEPSAQLPSASPPTSAPIEQAPVGSTPSMATEPLAEASPQPPALPQPAVLAEPPAVTAAHSAPQVRPVGPRAVARAPSATKKLGPSPSASPAERNVAAQASADVLEPYRNSLASHVRSFQRYPALARARRQEGLVVVHVRVERDGHIITMAVEQGSGSALLDQEALATLKRAEPMPVIPAALPGAMLDLVFPLRFALE